MAAADTVYASQISLADLTAGHQAYVTTDRNNEYPYS